MSDKDRPPEDSPSQRPTESTDSGPSHDVSVGQRVGEFEIKRLLGRGGMGSVYEATQTSMRRDVALKVLDAGLFPSNEQVQRFEREAWIAGRLNHPNIVKVHARGEVGNSRYIAMELVEGPTLQAELKQLKPEDLDQQYMRRMVGLFLGIAEALAYVHEQGIIHRDIKPLNLLLTKDHSRMLLSDFGLARDEETTRLTRRGDFMGTVRYMSPEQLLAHRAEIDHRSDIWSFGISLYEALTLKLPFAADSEEAFITAIGMKEPAPARKCNHAVPKELETVLMKCLERDPERRYQSAAELRDDLKRFLEGSPVLARRPGLVRRGRSWARGHLGMVAALFFVIAVVATGIIGGSIWQGGRESSERLRFTLEQVLTTGKEPWEIASDWEELETLLYREIEKDPEGELAVMAMRAYVDLDSRLHPVGLVDQPPMLSIGHEFSHTDTEQRHFPGVKCLATAEIEASLDGGTWFNIGSCIIQHLPDLAVSFQSIVNSEVDVALRDIAQGDPLTSGPHRVDVRTKLSILPPAEATVAPLSEHKDYCKQNVCELLPLSEFWPEGSTATPLHVETRDLANHVITLFEEYPADFPRTLTWDEVQLDSLPESWFESLNARLIRVSIPEGHSNAFAFDWPSESMFRDRRHYACLCWEQSASTVLSVGLWFSEKHWIYPPVPVAAKASFDVDGAAPALLRFDFTAAEKEAAGVYRTSRSDHFETYFEAWELTECEYDSDGPQDCDFVQQVRHSPPANTSNLEDGVVDGILTLVPSRRLALDENYQEPWLFYLGETLSIPLQVEVVTVPGRRIDDEDCEAIRRTCGWREGVSTPP